MLNQNQLFNELGRSLWKNKYCWAGTQCKSDEIKDFIDNKKYIVDDDEYDTHLNKVLEDPTKNAVD